MQREARVQGSALAQQPLAQRALEGAIDGLLEHHQYRQRVFGDAPGRRHGLVQQGVVRQNELAERVGSLVTVIMGFIFAACVMAFRRGMVGELIALYRRMIGEKVQ